MNTLILGGLFLAVALVGAFAGLIAAAYTLVTYGVWIVDRGIAGRSPEGRSELERQQFRGTVFREFFTSWLVFLTQPLGWIDPERPKKRLIYNQRPVVFVHGYAQTHLSMAVLRVRLALFGFGPQYAINLNPYHDSIHDHADRLSTLIDEILVKTGAHEVDVVAHSMGGLVARLAEPGDARRRIRRLVTLGTPHHGTRLAYLALGRCAPEMLEGSELLEGLTRPPPGMLVAISSEHDNVVVPCQNARMGTDGRDVLVRNVGHFAMLFNGQVAELVATSLGEDIQAKSEVLKPLTAPEVRAAQAPSARVAS